MPLLFVLLLLPLLALAGAPTVSVLTLDDAITPATADYVTRGLKHAEQNHASLVVIKLDTPGGLDSSMRDIIKQILASPIPVATYVSPAGARAASAGTYILYASHIAAMAPGTNLGAATPVAIGLGGPSNEPLATPKSEGNQAPDDKTSSPPAKGAMAAKQIHDASAYIRSLAQLRGRNVEWAESAVRDAVSLSADEALAKHVVDYVVPDINGLLLKTQGMQVSVAGKEVTLNLAGAELVSFIPDWRTRLLSVIASPSLALILMMIGIYGLLFELMSPGYVLPGVVGGICLLLALFAFQWLPFNYTGLALIALGMIFLVAEVFVPTSGALAIGGVIALAIGAVILFDTGNADFAISWPLVGGVAAVSALFVLGVVRLAFKARKRKVVSGKEEFLSYRGEVIADFTGEGWAQMRGETWRIRSGKPLQKGQSVRVVGVDGLTFDVEPEPTTASGDTPCTTRSA